MIEITDEDVILIVLAHRADIAGGGDGDLDALVQRSIRSS
jgi:hypothetical protein